MIRQYKIGDCADETIIIELIKFEEEKLKLKYAGDKKNK
jgi:hypothetical protein